MYLKASHEVDNAPVVTSWNPPTPNILKCNVDAAVFTDGAGYGAVVRNYAGRKPFLG